MTDAEYAKQRRERARCEGRCTTCTLHEVPPGRYTCADCLQVRALRKRAEKLGDSAFCVDCQRGDGLHRFGCRRPRMLAVKGDMGAVRAG